MPDKGRILPPYRCDTLVPAVHPRFITDCAAGTDCHTAVGTGGGVALDIGVARVDAIDDPRVGGDVPVVPGPGFVVSAVGAVIGIGRIETVGRNVVAVQVDLTFGEHRELHRRLPLGEHTDFALR